MKICLISFYSWLGVSPSLINFIRFSTSKGHKVYLFAIRPNLKKFPLPDDVVCNTNLKVFEGSIFSIFKEFFLFFKHRRYFFDLAIYFDLKGFIFFPFIFYRAKKNYFYSLELDENKSIIGRIKWQYINYMMKYTDGVIIQGNKRLEAFKLNSKTKKSFLIPNAPLKAHDYLYKHDYFRMKYDIPNNSKIILVSGSMIKEHLVDKIIASINHLPNDWVVVFHGWFPDKEIFEEFSKLKDLYPNNIFHSDEYFSYDDRFIPYISSNYLVMDYADVNLNLITAPESSGKLYEAQSSGTRIITTKKNIEYVLSKKDITFYASLNEFFDNLETIDQFCSYDDTHPIVTSEKSIELFLAEL